MRLWKETRDDEEEVKRALVRRLKQGEGMPGFGHRLYPRGDPRAEALFDALAGLDCDRSRLRFTRNVAGCVWELIGERPTIDFALAATSLVFDLVPGAALGLFALGRTVGWIGQAIEQMRDGQLIRPRARYTGPPSASA